MPPCASGNLNQTAGNLRCTLPLEVQERILDFLAGLIDTGSREALTACLLTCKAWIPRCRFHLLHEVSLRGRQEVFAFSTLFKSNPRFQNKVAYARIKTRTPSGTGATSQSMEHLSSFAARFSGRLPASYDLSICDAQLRPSNLHPDTFLHLSGFASLRQLLLKNVTFKTQMMLNRTICAFPGLALLQFTDIVILDDAQGLPLVVSHNHRPNIRHLGVDGSAETLRRILDFYAAASFAATLRTLVLGYRTAVPLRELSSSVQRLLNSAGQSLRTFSCVVDQHCFAEDSPHGTFLPSILAPEIALNHVLTAQYISFVPCTQLERVILRIPIHSDPGISWIPRLLSSITLHDNGEVYLCFVAEAGLDGTPGVLQALETCLLHSTLLAEVEAVMLQSGFAKLKRCDVDLEVVSPISSSFSSRTWSEIVASGMLQLVAQGIVR